MEQGVDLEDLFKVSENNYSFEKQNQNNLLNKLKNQKIDIQIYLYNTIKFENDKFKKEIHIEIDNYEKKNYNLINASLKSIQSDINTEYMSKINSNTLSAENIFDHFIISMMKDLIR